MEPSHVAQKVLNINELLEMILRYAVRFLHEGLSEHERYDELIFYSGGCLNLMLVHSVWSTYVKTLMQSYHTGAGVWLDRLLPAATDNPKALASRMHFLRIGSARTSWNDFCKIAPKLFDVLETKDFTNLRTLSILNCVSEFDRIVTILPFLRQSLTTLQWSGRSIGSQLWPIIQKQCPNLVQICIQSSADATFDKNMVRSFCRWLGALPELLELRLEGCSQIWCSETFECIARLPCLVSLRLIESRGYDIFETKDCISRSVLKRLSTSTPKPFQTLKHLTITTSSRTLRPLCGLFSATQELELRLDTKFTSQNLLLLTQLKNLISIRITAFDMHLRWSALLRFATECSQLRVLRIEDPITLSPQGPFSDSDFDQIVQCLPLLTELEIQVRGSRLTSRSLVSLAEFCPKLRELHLRSKYVHNASGAIKAPLERLQKVSIMSNGPVWKIEDAAELKEIVLWMVNIMPYCQKFTSDIMIVDRSSDFKMCSLQKELSWHHDRLTVRANNKM